MPKYIIERKVPGVGLGSPEQMAAVAQQSNKALNELNGQVQWLESFVTDDSTYCVYISPNEELIKRHAELSGFPANKITRVDAVIDPSTADMPQSLGKQGAEKMSEKPLRQ